VENRGTEPPLSRRANEMNARRPAWLLTALGIFTCFAAIAVTVAVATQKERTREKEEELDSVKVSPETQKVIFENEFVRVIDDRIPVGVAEPKHRHPHGVTVALTDYDIEQKNYITGKVTRSHRREGEVNWTEATIHDVRNVGSTPSHAIRIELKY
jgi:hypothetical protein